MANIMLNKVCNLKCPYCFANEFVNADSCKDNNNITVEDFEKALDFIVKSNTGERVGIIGGEPTLHPNFEKLMEILFNNEKVKHITLFTNGIMFDKYANILAHPKMTTLINFNSPNDIGEKAFKKICDNLDLLVNKMYLKNKIVLGINMYKPDFDFDYMVETLKKYSFTRVRTSISVPNTDGKKEVDVLEHFKVMKPRVFEFFGKLKEIGVMPTYDCNLMPQCILSPDEIKWLEDFWAFEEKCGGIRCNVTDNPRCSPVIDILPNLEVVRCFGCSNKKINLFNFDSTSDISGYFQNEIDIYSDMIPASEKCINCYYRRTKQCSGGCFAFKEKKVRKAKLLLERKIINGK